MKNVSAAQNWAYWIGILIVFGSHVYMLVAGLPEAQMVPHAILNLVAGAFIAYAWFGGKK